MKVLKKIIFVILGIIAFLLVVAIFVPKSYTVSVKEVINKPKSEVFEYVRMLENQKQYSVFVLADPDLNPQITGIDGTVGAIQKWNSKLDEVGEGEQEITAITPDRIDVDLRFKRPFEGNAKAANIFRSISENQTEIISEFYSNDRYPLNLMSYFIGRKMMKDSETQNLQNIKKILEK
jgi:hypothetical protein